MKNNILISIFVIFLFFISGFFLIRNSTKNITPEVSTATKQNIDIKHVNIAGQNIKVELALTSDQLARGLSGHAPLKEGEGMLFVFGEVGKYPFWMKDMNFPIDIIWLSEDLRVVYIKKDARPELYPETYAPGQNDKDAKYVLEVNSGFSKKNNLKIGDIIYFTY